MHDARLFLTTLVIVILIMSNSEEILRTINQECLGNPVPHFFTWLKNQKNYPTEKIIFESLEYFYQNGYRQFTNLEWGRKIKIDYRDKQATRPYADLIQSIYNLCKECHTLQDVSKVRTQHSNAYRWFASCILELIYLDFYLLTTTKTSNYFEIWEHRLFGLQKASYPSDFEVCVRNPPNKNSKKLDNKYNPFLNDKCLNLTLLIESSFSLKEVNPSFNTKYWEPFITAQKAIVSLKTNKYLQDVRLLPQTEEYQTKLPGRGRYKKPK